MPGPIETTSQLYIHDIFIILKSPFLRSSEQHAWNDGPKDRALLCRSVNAHINFRHFHLDVSSSLSKRDGISRAMNQCTAVYNTGHRFDDSTCLHDVSPIAVSVWCRRDNNYLEPPLEEKQSCKANEICVDSAGYHNTAYCVSTDLFTDVAAGEVTKWGYEVPGPHVAGHPKTAHALLVSQVSPTVMKARAIQLKASGRDAATGIGSNYRELAFGNHRFLSCYETILPLPVDTSYISAEVTPGQSGAGFLYLTTM